jgi:hypothetical protein
MAIPGILYHYCGNDSLLNIVRGRTLLLTAITAANDYGETHHARLYLIEKTRKHTVPPESDWLRRLVQLVDVFLAGIRNNPSDFDNQAINTTVQLRQVALIFKNHGFQRH